MRVKDIYTTDVDLISPQATLKEAVAFMIKEKTNNLVVVDEEKVFLGIVTAKDIIRAILPDFLEDKKIAALAGESTFDKVVKAASDVLVGDFMNTTISQVRLDVPLTNVAATVLYKNEARLPVVDLNKKVIGIVTRTQIKQAIAIVLGVE